jgi:hypothetical protein
MTVAKIKVGIKVRLLIITMSDFRNHHKREPNQEEMIEVSKVLFNRTGELREAILKSR